MAVGGLTKGKSHKEGGIPMVVKSTGQKIEVEGGEGILNKYSMSNPKKFEFEGEMLTTCQIASRLNQKKGNGVRFECDDVIGKKYLFKDGGEVARHGNLPVSKIVVHPDFYFQAERHILDTGGKSLYIDKSNKSNWAVYYTKSEDSDYGFPRGRYGVVFDSKFNPKEAKIFFGNKMIGVVKFKPMSQERMFPAFLVVEKFAIENNKFKTKTSVKHIIEEILDLDKYHKGIVIPCEKQPNEVELCMKFEDYNKTDNYYIINKDYGNI